MALTATTSNGCSNSFSGPVLIEDIKVFAGNDTTIWQGSPFTLHGSGGTKYNWQPAYLLNNAASQSVSGVLQNNQQFILKASDDKGCTGYDSVWVYVMLPLKIPNAFSPNGDGINDSWIIENSGNYSNISLEVFNRWGQLIHRQSGNLQPWNGTFNNKVLPVGTYYYILKINAGGKQQTISGSVTVLK